MSDKSEEAKQAAERFVSGVAQGMKQGAEMVRLEQMIAAVLRSPEMMGVAADFADRSLQAALALPDTDARRASAASDQLSWRTNFLIQNVVAIARTLRMRAEEQVKQPSPLEAWQPPEGAAQ